jgi:cell division protein FtsA
MLAAGIVLTGGTSKMEGVVDLAEEIFHAPVRIGAPHNVTGLADIVRNPIYSTGVGLLLYGLKQFQEQGGIITKGEPRITLVSRVKSWFQGDN